ncbi:MAG: hypothetical protein ABSH19_09775 [Opitutales bacterium]
MLFQPIHAFCILLLALGCGLLAPSRVLADPLPLENLGLDPDAKKAICAQLKAALATDPKNYDLRIHLGALLCELGGTGDEKASDEALTFFKNFYAEAPNDPEVRAFYGSACTIHAKYVFLLFKPSWANRGFGHLDAAIAAAPDNLNVRLIRALNSSEVPAFLGRDKVAREDFAWLLKRRATHPEEFTPAILRALYYYAGRYALQREEPTCVALLAQAAAIPGNAPLCDKIQTALQQARAKFPNQPATSSHA